jgi:hypothetical protein
VELAAVLVLMQVQTEVVAEGLAVIQGTVVMEFAEDRLIQVDVDLAVVAVVEL